MNIVYISSLSGKKSAGLTYSVPAQIRSQSKIDNVLWWNISETPKSKLINGSICYDRQDLPEIDISNLPIPFNKPNMVIFEGVYFFEFVKIAKQCRIRNISYVIIPRGSLTYHAQNKKKIKKILGNMFIFNDFIKNALGIQYLTNEEYQDSGGKWNKRHIIIPNGVEIKDKSKKHKKQIKGIHGVFIGRADTHHKGIDLLLDACQLLKDEMQLNNCKISIYAPSHSVERDKIEDMIKKRSLDNVVNKYDGIYEAEKEEILLKSDFFILTSRFEGHPMGLVEALSYGLPCLVTQGTNMADEIKKSNAGWTSDTSVKGIVTSLTKIFEEKELFREKGICALELSRKFNWDNLAHESNRQYSKLLMKNNN